MAKVLVDFKYNIVNNLNIPYINQLSESFSYGVTNYNDEHAMDPDPIEINAIKSVNYKLKYVENTNMQYNNVGGIMYLGIFLTNADKTNGYVGFHDNQVIQLNDGNSSYDIDRDNITVTDPINYPNRVTFDPNAVLPVPVVSNMRDIRTRDGNTFNPPYYSYDVICNMDIARQITISPTSFPYTFSIDDYNTDNNTKHIGVRRVVINSSVSSVIDITGLSFTGVGNTQSSTVVRNITTTNSEFIYIGPQTVSNSLLQVSSYTGGNTRCCLLVYRFEDDPTGYKILVMSYDGNGVSSRNTDLKIQNPYGVGVYVIMYKLNGVLGNTAGSSNNGYINNIHLLNGTTQIGYSSNYTSYEVIISRTYNFSSTATSADPSITFYMSSLSTNPNTILVNRLNNSFYNMV